MRGEDFVDDVKQEKVNSEETDFEETKIEHENIEQEEEISEEIPRVQMAKATRVLLSLLKAGSGFSLLLIYIALTMSK